MGTRAASRSAASHEHADGADDEWLDEWGDVHDEQPGEQMPPTVLSVFRRTVPYLFCLENSPELVLVVVFVAFVGELIFP